MYNELDSTRKKGNSYILIGLIFSVLFGGMMLYFGLQRKTTLNDLILISGEYENARAHQMVRKFYNKDNRSTIVSLENQPNNEFNIGVNITLAKFNDLIKKQEEPIHIKLHTTKQALNYNRDITPAFHGLKINDFVVLSVMNGLNRDNSNKNQSLIIGFLVIIIGIGLIFYGRKLKKPMIM